VHTVESIVSVFLVTIQTPTNTPHTQLLSVISLLSADKPNTDSPANVDAAVEVRNDPAGYKKKVRRLVRRSADEAFD
jgi:ubiquitin-conjugating enzyme E2 G1